MVITMSGNATEAQIGHVIDRVRECGFSEHVSRGAENPVIGVVAATAAEMRSKRYAPLRELKASRHHTIPQTCEQATQSPTSTPANNPSPICLISNLLHSLNQTAQRLDERSARPL